MDLLTSVHALNGCVLPIGVIRGSLDVHVGLFFPWIQNQSHLDVLLRLD